MASRLIELGSGRRGGLFGSCGPMGCGSKLGFGRLGLNLPIAGNVNIPSVVSIQPIKALIGGGTASIVSGLVTGVLNNVMPLSGAKYGKIGLGLVSALAFLSPKFRSNSYVVGFGFKNIVDMIEPFAQMLADMVVPASLKVAGMGALTPEQARALKRAALPLNKEGRFLQMNSPRMGFTGEQVMLPSDYMARARAAVPMSGPSAIGRNQLSAPIRNAIN